MLLLDQEKLQQALAHWKRLQQEMPAGIGFLQGMRLLAGTPLTDADADDAFKALMLEFPPEAEIAATIGKDINADHIRAARQSVRASVAAGLLSELDAVFAVSHPNPPTVRSQPLEVIK